MLVGEWGSSPERANDPADVYFREHQRLQDEFHFGATLWTWRESCGDPHKAGDARQGTVPYVWGEFDVDCTTNRVVGVRQSLVDQLDRAYVRAAPGRLVESTYDLTSGVLRGAGDHAHPGSAVVGVVPDARRSRSGCSRREGLRFVRVSSSGTDGGSYVTGVAIRSSWSVSIGTSH